MAITGPIKTYRLKRKTAKKKKLLAEWQVHRTKTGKKAMGYAQWLKDGRGKKIAYYGQKRETADALLRRIKRGK
jgi:hypothetical protein